MGFIRLLNVVLKINTHALQASFKSPFSLSNAMSSSSNKDLRRLKLVSICFCKARVVTIKPSGIEI